MLQLKNENKVNEVEKTNITVSRSDPDYEMLEFATLENILNNFETRVAALSETPNENPLKFQLGTGTAAVDPRNLKREVAD